MAFLAAFGIKLAASKIIAATAGAAAVGLLAASQYRRPLEVQNRAPVYVIENNTLDDLDETDELQLVEVGDQEPQVELWDFRRTYDFTSPEELIGNLKACDESETNQRREDEQENDRAEQSRSEQETESDQNHQSGGGQQGGGQQGGGQQGGGQSDGEDKSSDQESEERDSEEQTDDDKKQKTGKKKKTKRFRQNRTRRRRQNQRSVGRNEEESNNEINQNHPAAILIGLLNIRSLNNKIHQILQLIINNRLDVVCTTETWLNEDSGDGVLRRASPEDFRYYYQTRPGRGGGAAIQVRQVLQSIQIFFNSRITTFEVAATILQHETWAEPVLVISLYRRGSTGTRYRKFLDEFQDVLAEIFNLCNNVIVTGDFNVWVDDLRRGREFRCLLQAYQLVQQVREPTHSRGHTLDLVITRNVEVSRLSVQNDGVSDHYSVYFSARPESKNKRKKIDKKEEEDKKKKK